MSQNAIRHLLSEITTGAEATDVELLARFATARDESAFELLVWRHAALVHRVCLAVLRDHHAAEDAAQATFVVLARKAGSFTGRGSVVGWLYRVARRIAVRADRRRHRDRTAIELETVPDLRSAADPAPGQDEIAVLCAEVDQLPERFRVPVLLCHFEGLTHAEAARRLGWPLGTVAGRVRGAKERLARRLAAKGLGVPAIALGLATGRSVSATVLAAVAFVARYTKGTPVQGLEPSVLSLSEDALKNMTTWRGQLFATLVVACLVPVIAVAGVWAVSRPDLPNAPVALHAPLPKPPEGAAVVPGTRDVTAELTEKVPDPLPADLVARWVEVGAEPGWMTAGVVTESNFRTGEKGRAGELPAFRFLGRKPGGLDKLPAPQTPFGLDLCVVLSPQEGFTGELAGLTQLRVLQLRLMGVPSGQIERELARLTQVRTLFVDIDSITMMAALPKCLSGLTQLRALGLGRGLQVEHGRLDFLTGLTQLRALNLDGTQASDEGLKYLSGLTQLRTLGLGFGPVTDAGLEHLSGLSQLQTLEIGSELVTNAGLKHLSRLTQLRSLSLGSTKVTDAGLEHLSGLTQLQILELGRTPVTDAGLKHLSGLTQLRSLGLGFLPLTGAGLEHLRGMSQLRGLDLRNMQVPDEGLKHLTGFTQIQTLDLRNTPVTDAGLRHLSGLTQLQTLELSNTPVKGVGLKYLRGLPQLRTLNLDGAPVADANLKHLRGMSQLRTLDLRDTSVTDAGLKHLRGLPQLRALELGSTAVIDVGQVNKLAQPTGRYRTVAPVTNAGLEPLSELTQLQTLGLVSTKVTDAGLAHLSGLSQLQILDLRNSPVTDAGLKHLSGLSQLRTLDLRDTPVTGAGVAELRKALPNCTIRHKTDATGPTLGP